MAAKQTKQTKQAGDSSIGKPGGVVGNTYPALSLLLAVVSQTAPERTIAACATVGPAEAREVLAVRRAKVSDLRPGGHATGERLHPLTSFVVECNGAPTIIGTFDETRDLLSRMPLLDGARWTLTDLDKAPQVVDGR